MFWFLNLDTFFIQTLNRKEREYEGELASLTAHNVELQDRLSSLKTELNSEGHNVDTWLDSYPDIDYSTSTRTASEAEMYRTFDDDDEMDHNSSINKKSIDLITNNNHNGTKTNSCKYILFKIKFRFIIRNFFQIQLIQKLY